MNKTNNPSYFKYINGIRAIAILLIVLFHFSINNSHFELITPFKKGYLGVEIFMVIMGFLFIRGVKENPPTNFLHFITKKAKRILLPLSFVILITSTVCFLVIDSEQGVNIFRTGLTALLSISNYELAITTSDYFASNAALNALLHTWYTSFAVQFFIIAWIFYFISTKVSKKTYITFIFIISILSFICSKSSGVISIANELKLPSEIVTCLTSYYGTFPRLWIPIAGCSIIFLPNTSYTYLRNFFVLLGTGMIIAPLFLTLKSYDNILVTVGTILVIRYAQQTITEKILNARLLQKVGKLSFSIFLIHMPVVAFYRLFFIQAPNIIITSILLVLIFLLSHFFHKYIETYKGKVSIFYRYVPVISLVFCLVGVTIKKQRTFPLTAAQPAFFTLRNDPELLVGFNQEKIPYRAAWVSHETNYNPELHQKKIPFTQLGSNNDANFLLIGDSHAGAYIVGLDEICKDNDISGIALNSLLLPFYNRRYVVSDPGFCLNKEKYDAFFFWLSKHPELKTVILAFSYAWADTYLEEDWSGKHIGINSEGNIKSIRPFLQQLKDMNREVIVYAPLPRFKENNMFKIARYLRHIHWAENMLKDEYSCTQEEFEKRWGAMIKIVKDMEREGLCHIVNPSPILLKDDTYYAIFQNEIIFFDSNHISANTSRKIAKYLEPAILQYLKPQNHIK